MTDNFDPNSTQAMFATILGKLDNHGSQLTAIWDEAKTSRCEATARFEQQASDIQGLKTADKLHTARLKWAVAAVAVVGWGINAYIAWKRGA